MIRDSSHRYPHDFPLYDDYYYFSYMIIYDCYDYYYYLSIILIVVITDYDILILIDYDSDYNY